MLQHRVWTTYSWRYCREFATVTLQHAVPAATCCTSLQLAQLRAEADLCQRSSRPTTPTVTPKRSPHSHDALGPTAPARAPSDSAPACAPAGVNLNSDVPIAAAVTDAAVPARAPSDPSVFEFEVEGSGSDSRIRQRSASHELHAPTQPSKPMRALADELQRSAEVLERARRRTFELIDRQPGGPRAHLAGAAAHADEHLVASMRTRSASAVPELSSSLPQSSARMSPLIAPPNPLSDLKADAGLRSRSVPANLTSAEVAQRRRTDTRLLAPPAVPRHHTPASVRSLYESKDNDEHAVMRRSLSELPAVSRQLPGLGERTPSLKNRRDSRRSAAGADAPLVMAAELLKRLGALSRRLQVGLNATGSRRLSTLSYGSITKGTRC
jgi:hypothetical protein